MAETPEQLWARVAGSLRMPPVEEWETFPFDGDMRPRPLAPPVEREAPRRGEGGGRLPGVRGGRRPVPLDERALAPVRTCRPTGLPLVVILEPRAHYAEPGDLPDELAAELGVLLARIERAVRAVEHVGRVHVCRWGDGSEHLHWWFMARPARIPQLIGSFAAIWDDILPPVPEDVWRANLDTVLHALSE